MYRDNSLPGPYDYDDYLYYDGRVRIERGFEDQVACFVPGDVECLVCSCPSLELLWLPGLVQDGVDVSALLRLTALTGLFVGGDVWDDAVALGVLAGMSGLRELQLCDAPGFTDQALLALSALTGLTRLGTLHCGLSAALLTHGYFGLSTQVGDLGCLGSMPTGCGR
jgi:hypothetical protein